MAGFLFNLGGDKDAGTTKEQALSDCLASGVYATRAVTPTASGRWSEQNLALLGDFLSMRPGDHVYFLCGRNIYGVGELVSLGRGGCRLGNFPGACEPSTPTYASVRRHLLRDPGPLGFAEARWLCTFKPSPLFFADGVDMDVALSARPESMRRLPSNQDRTFIKLDDEEDTVLAQLLFRQNRGYFDSPRAASQLTSTDYETEHARIARRLKRRDYSLDVSPLLVAHRKGRRLSPEMALEIALIDCLARGDSQATSVFGQLDFLAHQVPASPNKKFIWMDKMDVFGYSYAPASLTAGIAPPTTAYVIAEMKQGRAQIADVSQLMSYVDWVTDQWAGKDPSLVRAFLVAASFPQEVREAAIEYGRRFYSVGRRGDARTEIWSDLVLVSYKYDRVTQNLSFAVESAPTIPAASSL